MREIADAIIENGKSDAVKDEIDFLFHLTVVMMIDPFKVFVPVIDFISDYDILNWVKDGYTNRLRQYKTNEPITVQLTCRNSVTVSSTIKKDRAENRTDCYNFFRYMNSGLMRRYVYSDEFNISENSPWEPFRKEHRTDTIAPSDTLFGAFEKV